jgi:hypothetical protein
MNREDIRGYFIGACIAAAIGSISIPLSIKIHRDGKKAHAEFMQKFSDVAGAKRHLEKSSLPIEDQEIVFKHIERGINCNALRLYRRTVCMETQDIYWKVTPSMSASQPDPEEERMHREFIIAVDAVCEQIGCEYKKGGTVNPSVLTTATPSQPPAPSTQSPR